MNTNMQYNVQNHLLAIRMATVLLAVVSLLAVSCRHEHLPQDVMDHEAMAAFLTDAYLIEGDYAIETQYRYDRVSEEATRSYDSVLSVHGVSREDVERSLDYYSSHLDEYKSINDEVVARLEALRDSLAR